MKKSFNKITDIENLFFAWDEFRRGKSRKKDVLKFEKNLEQNIFDLHRDLRNKTYTHGDYENFYICDPKLRHIYKATVRDRVLHHAIFHILNPFFEPTFISTSFSCRIGKGNHKGVMTIRKMLNKISKNNTRTCYVLKCDVRKFFDSIDHSILLTLLSKRINDSETMSLLTELIGSYEIWNKMERERERESTFASRKGIPIGNLTSQLFANIYMSEFDHFMKTILKVKNYARYTDDFVIISENKEYLENLLYPIEHFLKNTLELSLHQNKVSIEKYSQGIDFLGYVLFPHYTLTRKRTWKRLYRNFEKKLSLFTEGHITKENLDASLQSYLAVLSHANAYKQSEYLKNRYWLK